tara:strand:- start:158 stop:544 length:387 start_codon:yes stop_codon:yes gene_type:complete
MEHKKILGLVALLVHAAKIDEQYTQKEKGQIIRFIESINKNDHQADKILKEAEILETDSNQILNFTKLIKNNSLEFKTIVVKELWKIILSDNSADEFESNLMRRICGLIYFSDKTSGEIKAEILKKKI